MNTQVLFICGAIAGIMSVFAYLPYIADTLKGRTQPQRSSWLIWAVLASAAFFAQVAEGASYSLWFTGIQAGGAVIVFLLSIRLGAGNFLNQADSITLVSTAFGFFLWYITESAIYTLAISIIIGVLGGLLTIAKAYRDPDSESMSFWLVSGLAGLLALVSVGKLDIVIMAYPFYLVALYGSIVAAMFLGRAHGASPVRRKQRQPVQTSRPVQGPVVYRKLVQANSKPGLLHGLDKLNDDKITALVFSLKKRGVGDHVINDALHDIVHG